MVRRALLTTDLHLTVKPDDEYRWIFLHDLVGIAEENEVDEILVLGDLTHDKDRHSAELVNRIVEVFKLIAARFSVRFLKGNHDYVNPEVPFMRFLRYMPGISFYSGIHKREDMLFLPHTRNPMKDWKKLRLTDWPYIFMHQTLRGSVASTGHVLDGIPQGYFSECNRVFSGDVHPPQRRGRVTYVGTPYAVHFGDDFDPRVIVLDVRNNMVKSIPYSKAPKKLHLKVRSLDELANRLKDTARPGDYVKVQMMLTRAEFPEWKHIKSHVDETLREAGVLNKGVDMRELRRERLLRKAQPAPTLKIVGGEEAVQVFGSRERLERDLVEYGRELL